MLKKKAPQKYLKHLFYESLNEYAKRQYMHIHTYILEIRMGVIPVKKQQWIKLRKRKHLLISFYDSYSATNFSRNLARKKKAVILIRKVQKTHNVYVMLHMKLQLGSISLESLEKYNLQSHYISVRFHYSWNLEYRAWFMYCHQGSTILLKFGYLCF